MHEQHDRIPPNNLEAEAAVLGAVMVDASQADRVFTALRPEDFHSPACAAVFGAMESLHRAGEPIDKVSVAEELSRTGWLERLSDNGRVGGIAMLTALLNTVPSAASVEYYSKIVSEHSARRALIAGAMELREEAFALSTPVDEVLAKSMTVVQTIVDRSSSTLRRPMTMAEASYDVDCYTSSGLGNAIPTPFHDLNERIGGLYPGTQTILAASPKMGKTFMAATIATYIASLGVGTVAIIPLEIGRREQQMRLEAMYSGVTSARRRDGRSLTTREYDRLDQARAQLEKLDLVIFDSYPAMSTDDVIIACRRLASAKPLAALFVDHVGFLTDVLNHGRDSKHDRLEQAQSKLLNMSRKIQCATVLVSHLTRAAEDKEPTIFQLRDGGNAEGYAHHILFVHRPHWDAHDGTQRDGKIIIGASRSGRHGAVKVFFDDARGVWTEPNGRAWYDPPIRSDREFQEATAIF